VWRPGTATRPSTELAALLLAIVIGPVLVGLRSAPFCPRACELCFAPSAVSFPHARCHRAAEPGSAHPRTRPTRNDHRPERLVSDGLSLIALFVGVAEAGCLIGHASLCPGGACPSPRLGLARLPSASGPLSQHRCCRKRGGR